MPSWIFRCWSCGKSSEIQEQVGRRDECPQCGVDVRVCKNCRHFEPGAYNQCKESTAERVTNKDRANFCGMFQLEASSQRVEQSAEDARARLEALFKKPS